VPLLIYIPFVLPRLRKVKKDYLFHQYLKKKYDLSKNNPLKFSKGFWKKAYKLEKPISN